MSQELDEEANEHTRQHVHHHTCSNLFGCGDEKGIGILREDIKERAFDDRASDRLLHMDEIDQANLEGYLSARGRRRRKFLQASSFMGALAAVGPWFGKLARADEAGKAVTAHQGEGRVHVVPSTKETVQLGVYDTNLPPILTIDSGDSISFPDTWSHFLNELQPGVSIDTLARLRMDNPGKGPQSIIGPIAVNNAEPGDVLEVRHKRIRSYEWGATFNNPSSVGTGLLPQDYPQGQVKYVDLDLGAMTSKFLPNITIPLRPFQGHLGRGAAGWLFPAFEPWGDQRGAPRATCWQSRSERVDRRIDALHSGVETRGAPLYRGQPRRAGRWRDLPFRDRDPHEGAANPSCPPQEEELGMAPRRDGQALDRCGSRQRSQCRHDSGRPQRDQVPRGASEDQ